MKDNHKTFSKGALDRIEIKELCDPSTGEVWMCLTSRQNSSTLKDSGFSKIWLAPFLAAMRAFSIKKLDVFAYIIQQGEKNCIIAKTIQEIAKEARCSYQTAQETLQLLENNDIISRDRNGVVTVNPSVIFNGRAVNRAVAIRKYKEVSCRAESKKAIAAELPGNE